MTDHDEGMRLAGAIDTFARTRGLEAGGSDDDGWHALLEAMASTRSGRFALLGRPPFVSDARLAELEQEARTLRAGARPGSDDPGQAGQFSAPVGPAARALVRDRGWHAICRRELSFEPRPPYYASYLYYDRPGAGIVPHVDDPEFAVNVLFMVSRSGPAGGGAGSATVLHPPGEEPLRLVLAPGEAVLLEADGLVHAREPMAPGERVTVLTMGFSRPAPRS
ncbi:MAG: hypothetical protein QOG42_1446 [Solirubrobacteraceae bacterium]|jgi:hypothetical protein|nr:hypothetical protein [Solirubrobacteraceae bacterium]